jgi:glycosyltransferase involved in cell wall biosynthesis
LRRVNLNVSASFAALALRRAIRKHGIDLVHAHTAHAVATAALATLGTRVPFVVSRRVDFRLRDNVGTRLKYGRAALFIAVSNAVATVLEASGIDRSRIAVVPDGVDVHRVVEPARRGPEPLVVQVTALVGHKDPLNFVRAVDRARQLVPELRAALVGDGPLRAEVEAEVARLGLGTVVRVAGFRPDADEILASADVVCLSSREEGMGSVLLDALVMAKPIAATLAGGIPEVVGDCGVLVPVQDPKALGEAIARLIRDETLAADIRSRTSARAAAFSVERMADRTIEVYERVLGTGG